MRVSLRSLQANLPTTEISARLICLLVTAGAEFTGQAWGIRFLDRLHAEREIAAVLHIPAASGFCKYQSRPVDGVLQIIGKSSRGGRPRFSPVGLAGLMDGGQPDAVRCTVMMTDGWLPREKTFLWTVSVEYQLSLSR